MVPPENSDDWRKWRLSIDERLDAGNKRFERNEELASERYKKAGERHREVMGAIEGLRAKHSRGLPEYKDVEEEDEISGVTDVEELQKKARRQRAARKSAERWKKWGKALAPVLVGFSIGIWEIVKHTVLK